MFAFRDLLRRSLRQHPAFGQHHDAVGEIEDDAHVVLDQHDRQALLPMQAPDQPRDLVGLLIAHPRRRFVEHEKARAQRERHHDFRGALVAVR